MYKDLNLEEERDRVQAIEALRTRVRLRLEERRLWREATFVTPDPDPRYDEVFNFGVSWLNRL